MTDWMGSVRALYCLVARLDNRSIVVSVALRQYSVDVAPIKPKILREAVVSLL